MLIGKVHFAGGTLMSDTNTLDRHFNKGTFDDLPVQSLLVNILIGRRAVLQ